MVLGKPLFGAMDETQMLQTIFSILGTPTREDWPGMELMPNFKQYASLLVPRLHPQSFDDLFPTLEPEGRRLLRSMLAYDPSKRITAREALRHPYFDGQARGKL